MRLGNNINCTFGKYIFMHGLECPSLGLLSYIVSDGRELPQRCGYRPRSYSAYLTHGSSSPRLLVVKSLG
jgi:hypothetical protein